LAQLSRCNDLDGTGEFDQFGERELEPLELEDELDSFLAGGWAPRSDRRSHRPIDGPT
jgi:hypothetical protein